MKAFNLFFIFCFIFFKSFLFMFFSLLFILFIFIHMFSLLFIYFHLLKTDWEKPLPILYDHCRSNLRFGVAEYLYMMQGYSVRKMQYCLGTRWQSPATWQKCCFLLFTLAIKTCNIEANTTLCIWAWRNLATLNFLSDIHWFNTIKYF